MLEVGRGVYEDGELSVGLSDYPDERSAFGGLFVMWAERVDGKGGRWQDEFFEEFGGFGMPYQDGVRADCP